MGTITTGTGLISGLDTSSIIDQLMKIDGKQTDLYQAKVDDATAQKTAFLDLTTRLTGLNISAQSLAKPSFFSNAKATSSNEDVLTATAGLGAAVGSYQFRVARLVQSEQLVSGGFSDYDKSPVGAGTLTVEVGGGGVTQSNALSDLLGGKGVSRGQFRITDRAGHSDVIDLSDAVTLDDVVKKINTSVNVSVKATISQNRLTLADNSGAASGNLVVQDLGTTTSAADLGIASTSMFGTISGTPLMYVGRDTRLSTLNDGNGVQDSDGDDFSVAVAGGQPIGINLAGATTVGGVLDQINTLGSGKITASVSADGSGIQLTSVGGGAISVTEGEGSTTAADLGLTTGTAAGATLTGGAVQAGLGTVLLKTLNGGSGVTLGQISITDRGGVAHSVDLSGAKTVQDTIAAINAAGAGVTADVKASGNGIRLTPAGTGTGNVVIADTSGTGAAQLGIAGTFDLTATTIQGANLQRKWVSGGMALSDYNGGKGVPDGEFTVTAGVNKFDIDVSSDTDRTLGDVISKINKSARVNTSKDPAHPVWKQMVTASVNAHGDGLLLTDVSGAGTAMEVTDKGGGTAKALGIAGKAVTTSTSSTVNNVTTVTKTSTIDGTMEKTIAIDAKDTLADVQTKINTLSAGVTASIINDGSGSGSYRLSLNAIHSGAAGEVTFDAGTTKLNTRTLVAAQDAAVFVGSGDGDAQPLLVTSSKNQISGAVKGVTLNLTSVSKDPVSISVTNDVTNVTDSLQKFVDAYNDLNTKIDTYTKFEVDDPSADQATTDKDGNKIDPTVGTKTTSSTGADGSSTTYRQGVLLGDYSVSQIQTEMTQMLQTVVTSAGKYNTLSQVGLTYADDGTLQFNADTFNTAYADDPDSVKSLFTATSNAITNDTQLSYLNGGGGVATAGDGVNDFQAKLKDGSTLDVAVGKVATVGDVLSSLNAAGKGKLHAELDSKYHLVLTDLTTGTKETTLVQQNGSQFLTNLGLASTGTAGAITGRQLVSSDPLATAKGGIGVAFQQTINGLINPVNGLISNENNTLDDRISTYQDRITDLNAVLASKRDRLQKQFDNMEEVLSKLKTQQSSLSSIGSS